MIDSWVEFCTHELEIPLCSWVLPVMGVFDEVPEATKQAKEDVNRGLDVLNKHLLHNTFLVGHQVTLADICMVCSLVDAMKLVLDPRIRGQFGNVMRWFDLCIRQPEFQAVLGNVQLCEVTQTARGAPATAPAATPAPKAQNDKKKEAAAKKEAKKEEKKEEKKDKKDKKQAEGKKGAKPEEETKELTPEQLEEEKKKKMKKVVKEGGKRGVEIEGAADMGGLQFFCTSVDEPEGDLELLGACVDAMNAQSDPTEEERKGGSGKIGKMLFSAGTEQLAVLAYVPDALKDQIDAVDWLKTVLALFGGQVLEGGTKVLAKGFITADTNANKFPLKMKEPSITEAISYLKKKGLFPDKDDSDDDMVFGDDDFPS